MGSHLSSWLVLLLLVVASVCGRADGAESLPRRTLLGSQKHHYAYRQDVPLYGMSLLSHVRICRGALTSIIASIPKPVFISAEC